MNSEIFHFNVYRGNCKNYLKKDPKNYVIGACIYTHSDVKQFYYSDLKTLEQTDEINKYIGIINVWDKVQNQSKQFKIEDGCLYSQQRFWKNENITLDEASEKEKLDLKNWTEPIFTDNLAYITFKLDEGKYHVVDDINKVKLDTIYISNINNGNWLPLTRDEIIMFDIKGGYAGNPKRFEHVKNEEEEED